MAESKNKKSGEGSDNYGQAAKQTANAAKEMGKKTAQQAAAKGAEASGRAAVATVKAGAQAGKAVANIAAGTAAGGPWGAIIAAAWSLRHTLFKIFVCICLIIVFLVVIIISWPSIVFDKLMDDLFGSSNSGSSNTLNLAYSELSDGIYNTIDKGYQFALEEVERIIAEGDYDYDISVSVTEDLAHNTKDYDVCYILSAYSASVKQQSTSQSQMINKLASVRTEMFPVTYEEKTMERPKADEPSETETVKYVACVIHEFDEKVILKAFNIDPDIEYENYNITYGEYIEYMSKVLKLTLFGNTE